MGIVMNKKIREGGQVSFIENELKDAHTLH